MHVSQFMMQVSLQKNADSARHDGSVSEYLYLDLAQNHHAHISEYDASQSEIDAPTVSQNMMYFSQKHDNHLLKHNDHL